MDELLQKLFEAEVLSDETKQSIQEAFKVQLDEAVEIAKKEAQADVKAQLTEQFIAERDTLVEALDSKIGEHLELEISELKEDIERFRDLEAEYADKLVEAKTEMAEELKQDVYQLVESIDHFLEIRLNSELQELREDIDSQKQNVFGRRIFEAFADEYMKSYADEDAVYQKLQLAEQKLEETTNKLKVTESEFGSLNRKIKMQEVLKPLSGKSRDVMEAILKNVETSQLEEGYKTFIGRVIRETEDVSEKDGEVLAENASLTNGKNKTILKKEALKESLKNGIVKSGDKEAVTQKLNENQDTNQRLFELRKLAGIS